MALLSGPPLDGFYRRGGADLERASQGEQVEGGRDKEASQRGSCSGGCRRLRSGLNKLAYDITYDISWSSCMISNFISWDVISIGPQHHHCREGLEALEASTCSIPGLDGGISCIYNHFSTKNFSHLAWVVQWSPGENHLFAVSRCRAGFKSLYSQQAFGSFWVQLNRWFSRDSENNFMWNLWPQHWLTLLSMMSLITWTFDIIVKNYDIIVWTMIS